MGLKGLLDYFPTYFCVCLEVSITKSLGFFSGFCLLVVCFTSATFRHVRELIQHRNLWRVKNKVVF